MPRVLSIGNGSMLVNFDAEYRIADFYFPRVGMENQAAARFRFGVWADERLSWIEEAAWTRNAGYLRDTLVTAVQCQNDGMGLRLRCYDAVDAAANILLRKIVVRNLRDEERRIKLFFHHDLGLYGNSIGDTAIFDPENASILHYKARRYVLINVATEDASGVTEYACGRTGIGGLDGSWRDAEDGALSMTPIAQGSVDSTIAVPVKLDALGTLTVSYWMTCGRTYGEVRRLDRIVREESVSKALARTASYWYTWVKRDGDEFSELPEEIVELYRRSLLIVRTQCDDGGGILAANDSDIQWGHNDHYSYVWARDAVFVSDAMDRAGYPEITRRFLGFASAVIKEEGYLLHKYHPDGSLASLWHPWIQNGKPQLPIQEDETALIPWLIARHYERFRDLELVRAHYQRLVIAPAEFLYRYRDATTGLPLPSYDFWEERYGVFTFTCAAVFAGLMAAAEMANLFNEQERRTRYRDAADALREATIRHLWLDEEEHFARGLVTTDLGTELDKTADASLFGIFYLGMLPSTNAMVEGTVAFLRARLAIQTEMGGLARYEGDAYHRIADDTRRVPGNPWLICTLWMAEHLLARARAEDELQPALDVVRWIRSKAPSSLVLPEQINPYDGQPLSVAPMTWSHAAVISVVRSYVERSRALLAQ